MIDTVSARARPKFEGLQILRALAACLVIVTHATYYTSERFGLPHGERVWVRGGSGVDLFFVLSGFVMIYSSQRLARDPEGWRIFAERRLVRIVPMYWLITTIKLLIMLATAGLVLHASLSLPKALCSYLFIPSYNIDGKIQPVLGVGWTLNFEMFFYLIFALALWFRVRVLRFVSIVLSLLAVGAYCRHDSWPAVSFYLNTIVLEFLFGMLIAHWCLQRRTLPPVLAFFLLLMGFAALLLIPNSLDSVSRGWLAGVPAALMVWGMTSLEPFLARVPRIVLFIAEASYVMYLFHPLVAPAPAAVMAHFHLIYPTLAAVLAFFLSLCVGSGLHVWVERPVTAWFRDHLRVRQQEFVHVQ